VKHRGYLLAGALYVLLSLPGWTALLLGRLFASRNPYLLISLLGAPVGVLLLVFGMGRPSPNSRSGTAIRFAVLGLVFLLLALGSQVGVGAGVEPLKTSVAFCVMASSYLALVALVFLIAAVVSGRRTP
jgi:hypothetical protein